MRFKCKKCGEVKGSKSFSPHKKCRSGFDVSRCKSCKTAKSSKEFREMPIEKRIFNRARYRAKIKGWDFNIELADIVLPNVCPILKVPFKYGDINYTYSIDRIDNDKGYIKGNIQIISNRANRIKGDVTIMELELVLKHLKICEIV